MMKMYSEIKKENNFNNDDELHELNLFFARLLFCFFKKIQEYLKKRYLLSQ